MAQTLRVFAKRPVRAESFFSHAFIAYAALRPAAMADLPHVPTLRVVADKAHGRDEKFELVPSCRACIRSSAPPGISLSVRR